MSKSGLKESLKTLNVYECGAIDKRIAKKILKQHGMGKVDVIEEVVYPVKD